MPKRYGLQTLIFALTFFLVAGTSAAISWFSYKKSVRVLTNEFDQRAEIMIRNFAHQAFEGIVVQDPFMLETLCTGILQEDKVMYALVYDHSMHLIYQLHKQEYRFLFAGRDTEKLELRQAAGKIKKAYLKNFLDIVKEVPDRTDTAKSIGYVRMGVSLTGILAFKQQLIKNFIITFAFVLSSGLLLSYFLVKNLTAQLKKIVRAMTSIISGSSLTERIQDKGHIWEAKEIQTHFNTMMDKLSSSQEALNNTIYELSQSREQLNLALEASEAGLWDWNIPSGKVIFNKRWGQMLGYFPNELEGNVSTWEKLVHPDDTELVMDVLNSHLKGEIPLYRAEHRMRCKNGSWLWILDTGKVVTRDEKGRPVRAIGTHIDIQEQKNIESELKKHRENLEGLVQERTAKLEQMQHELLNKAVEAGRAQLSAMVLHNIGNAVTPVSVGVEKLKKSGFGNISRYLSECYKDLSDHQDGLTLYITQDKRGRKVAQYMGSLIHALETQQQKNNTIIDTIFLGIEYVGEILSLQRAYAPDSREMKEKIVLDRMIDDALRIQEGAIKKRQIHIARHFHNEPFYLMIEKNKFMQVLINLLKNSCDAIDEHPEKTDHKITVKTFQNSNRIGLSISDTGCGIEPDHINELFEFGTSSKGSSGFGLYYCRSFIETINGNLTLVSNGKNQGAEARIEFEFDNKKRGRNEHSVCMER